MSESGLQTILGELPEWGSGTATGWLPYRTLFKGFRLRFALGDVSLKTTVTGFEETSCREVVVLSKAFSSATPLLLPAYLYRHLRLVQLDAYGNRMNQHAELVFCSLVNGNLKDFPENLQQAYEGERYGVLVL